MLGFDAAVFADAQKDDPVNGHLHGEVKLAFVGDLRVAQGNIAGQQGSPFLDLAQEGFVHAGGTSLGGVVLGVFIESAFSDGIRGEDAGNLVPMGQVLVISEIHDA